VEGAISWEAASTEFTSPNTYEFASFIMSRLLDFGAWKLELLIP
jgi:hypothetical protein